MDYVELIDRFIAKELDTGQEDLLFRELQAQPELRKALHSSIVLEKEMGRKMAALAPAASETAGIFSSLGFAPAGLSSVGSGSAVALPGLNAFWSGFTTLLLGIMAYLGLTAIPTDDSEFMEADNYDYQNPITNQKIITNINNSSINNITDSLELAIVPEKLTFNPTDYSANSNFNTLQNTPTGNTAIKSNKKVDPKNRSSVSFDNPDKPSESFTPVYILPVDIGYNSDFTWSKFEIRNANSRFPGSINNSYSPNSINHNFSNKENLVNNRLEISGNSPFNTLPQNISTTNSDILSDLSIAFLYPAYNDLYIGLSFDRRTYYLNYEAETVDGLFEFRQNTLYSSLQGVIQYMPMGENNMFNPYLRLGAGLVSIGPTASLQGGFYIPLIGNLDATLGFEYQGLGYWIEEDFYNSTVYGLRAGLSIGI